MKKLKIRAHLDLRDERLSYKIRDAQIHKIPYQLVLGSKEIQDQSVTYRQFGSDEQQTTSIKNFLELITKEIQEKL
jgi:threonyl-tRNA synthetase